MKRLFVPCLFLYHFTIFGQEVKKDIKNLILETSCGQCQFGMKAKGCDLAIRLDGKTYVVTGTKIDDHGDAHAQEGFCNAIRQAKVSGILENGIFMVSSFELLPVKKK